MTPAGHHLESIGLRLHAVRRGKVSAPAVVVLHARLDQRRARDWVACALAPAIEAHLCRHE